MTNRADCADCCQPNNTHAPPPEYFGPRDSAKNQAEFARRRAAGACFHCPRDKVDYTLWHTLCPTHGKDSRRVDSDRYYTSKCVRGAGRSSEGTARACSPHPHGP